MCHSFNERMGVVIVVSDEDGELMLSLCKHVVGISTPAVAELNAL